MGRRFLMLIVNWCERKVLCNLRRQDDASIRGELVLSATIRL